MRFSFLGFSLRVRLVLLTSLLLGSVAVFLGLFLPSKLSEALRRSAEYRAISLGELLSHVLVPRLEANDAAGVRELLAGLQTTPEVSYALVRRGDGTLIAALNAERASDVPLKLGAQPTMTYSADHLRMDRTVRSRDGAAGILTIGFTLDRLENERRVQARLLHLTLGLVALFGILASFGIGTLIARSLRHMTEVALRIADGDLTQPPLGVLQGRDEVGQMAAAFDRMLLSLRVLSQAADRLGRGDLTVRVDLQGQVAAAFNRMIDGQRELIGEIADAAMRLAGASIQLYELVQRQEEATARQAAGVEEVSRTVQSLLESASNIAEASSGVFGNAQRTCTTTELISTHVSTLTGHTNRIAELLEVIRDIADRSDLLALNASLEATRAGDAGRAFSLVASEMRRLAERVTASVQDVKGLLTDIRSAGAASAVATQEGRKLADSTTESAHHITMVTQQQRTATGQVLDSMREINSILTASVASARETRASVEMLRRTADQFRALIGAFRLEGGAAATGTAADKGGTSKGSGVTRSDR